MVYSLLICDLESKDSRMFKDFPADLMASLANEPLTENSHEWSISSEVSLVIMLPFLIMSFTTVTTCSSNEMSSSWNTCVSEEYCYQKKRDIYSVCLLLGQRFNGNEKLKEFYRILSTNTDEQTEFVSTVEGENLPFILFHSCDFYDCWIKRIFILLLHSIPVPNIWHPVAPWEKCIRVDSSLHPPLAHCYQNHFLYGPLFCQRRYGLYDVVDLCKLDLLQKNFSFPFLFCS